MTREEKRIYQQEWRLLHPGYQQAWRRKNRVKCLGYQRTSESVEYHRRYAREWKKKNRNRYLQRNREDLRKRWSKAIPGSHRRLRNSLAGRIRMALKRVSKKAGTTEFLLGASIAKVKMYLARRFKPGMSWKNHGIWHIDHIRPCASFDLSKPEQQKECFHYSNLQPLWATDNIKKGSKL